MEKKYYTPEIEEFHEGFSHEYKGPLDTKWHKEDFKLKGPNPNFSWFLTEGHFRVKFLDREDIESLGFEYSHEHTGIIARGNVFIKGDYSLEYSQNERNNDVYLFIKDEEVDYIHFSGKIKNKSELVTLLKQLGI